MTVPYQVGTMIELPRAALRAGEIAESAEFFSFGTNDLTQTTLGVSRDDAASFLGSYTSKGLLPGRSVRDARTPEGVGELVKIAAERGRATRPDRSSSASAANTAAIPPASRSARASGSTMCRARRSAFRSRGWRRRRRRWDRKAASTA